MTRRPQRPLRIGFLCQEIPPDPHGGIGVVVMDLALELARRGHRIVVFGFSPTPREERPCQRVRIIRLPRPRVHQPHVAAVAGRLALAFQARRLVKRFRLDLVEVPDWMGWSAFFRPLLPRKTPLVIRYHGNAGAFSVVRAARVSRLTLLCEGRALATADCRIAATEFIDRATRAIHPALGHADFVVPNGTDLSRWDLAPEAPGERDPGLFLYVGRLQQAKGVGGAIALFRQLRCRNPQARLVLAGPPGDPLEALPEGTQVAGRLDSADLATLYRRATAVMVPGAAEAFSLVALEAMASGCIPLVNVDSGAADVVEDGVTGFHVDYKSPGPEAQRILDALPHAARLRVAGRDTVRRRFSLSAMAHASENVYRSILRGSQIP